MCHKGSSSGVQKPSYPSLSHQRNRTVPRRTLLKQLRERKRIERCKSEPCLGRINGVGVDNEGDRRGDVTTSWEVLFRPQTCSNVFFSPDYLNGPSPQSSQGYKKDAKVVVNVTVEGTPGPIRTMVKLGSSVEEIIRLVLDKYREEGRSPHLDETDSSSFKLYTSHFSLQSLSNSDVIGDVGSRSFHLRKSNHSNNSIQGETSSTNPFLALREFVALKINKFIRRTSKLWKFLGCIQCFE